MDYKFEKLLGEGGFGQAWLVSSTHMTNQVVFKFCSPRALVTLKNEAKLQKTLLEQIQKGCAQEPERFAGFVKILDTHLDFGPYYYVRYEFVPGGNLREYMKNFGRCFRPFEAGGDHPSTCQDNGRRPQAARPHHSSRSEA